MNGNVLAGRFTVPSKRMISVNLLHFHEMNVQSLSCVTESHGARKKRENGFRKYTKKIRLKTGKSFSTKHLLFNYEN
jgi:hypothetical protein